MVGIEIARALFLRGKGSSANRPTVVVRARAGNTTGKKPKASGGGGGGSSIPPGSPGKPPKGVPRRKRKNSTRTRQQRAKTNTDNMDNRRGGHSKGKHGTQVTPAQHEDRLRTGLDPSTGKIPTDKKGKPIIPKKSSGFDSDEKHLEALGKADNKLQRGISDGSIKPEPDGSYKVTVDAKDAGTSYSLNPPNDRTNGKVVTTKVHKATAIYKPDPVTGKPKLVTLFPGP